MSLSIESLTALLLSERYLILFPAAVIEGPIVTIIAGSLISFGYMSFFPAFVIIVVGDTLGDYLHYALGRYGGLPFVRRWGKYIGLKSEHVISLEKMFNGREGKVFFLGKLAHGFGGALLVAAGMVRMPLGKFLFWNVLGTIPKTLLLIAIGYYAAHAILKFNSVLNMVASITVVLGALGILLWVYLYNKRTIE